MRKKSPASVQKWVDSIQIPSGTGAGEQSVGSDAQITTGQDNDPSAYVSNYTRSDQLAAGTAPQTEGHDRPDRGWTGATETGEPLETDSEEERQVFAYDHQQQHSDQPERVLIDSDLNKHSSTSSTTNHGLPSEPPISSLATSTPKAIKPDEGAKQMPVSEGAAPSGLSIRNFLSKKSLLGKFNRSGSNLEQSPPTTTTAGESVADMGNPEHVEHGRHGTEKGEVTAAPSPFVVGKSKINEFYDKLNMNKAKYGLMKAKNLDIRNMLSGGSRESADPRKAHEAQPVQSGADEPTPVESGFEGELEPPASESEHERSVSPQHHEPLEVSVVDVDPTDPYEFSFDESFPKSDELIPGMISEEDEEEKENILDGASVLPGYGYDAYLNPPKPKTHRMGIGRIGRSSSENPRATARRYNLMEIGRSFSEMNDDDDSFAISECNNSCPNPSSLNTSSSINEHGSVSNLTRSVPVSPIPRTSSKLSIQQDHPSQHQLHQQQQQPLHQQQSSPRRRSTMLVKDSSLQSDSSRCSSVESLLNARKPDPEKILVNLGFGPAPHSTDVLAKIPKRFLKPSQVRGVDTEAFLRQQQLSMHIHENSVLGYRGLVVTDHDRVVTCYISTWAVYRTGSASYPLDAFDPTLCTHAIYAFAGLDEEKNTIKSLDAWQDLKDNYGKGGYEKLTGMRAAHPHLKVLLAIGGWNEGSEKYSNLAANPERRQAFVKNALDFVKQYGFDGLDLDWEYPTQRGGKPADRENFVALVRELSQLFRKHNLLLTSAFGAGKDTIDSAYDVKALSKYLDFLHIMCYDYKGSWDGRIGPNAPLTSRDFLNVEYSIEHLLELGAPASKLVLGLPFYGRTFVSPMAKARLGDTSDKVGFAGPSTKENGFMGYNEVCEELKRNPDDWTLEWDAAASEMVAIKSNGTASQVVVYDSTRSIANKVRFAVRQKLAGLMVWSVDTDDFNGLCAPEADTYKDFGGAGLTIPPPVSGKYPLLKTISNAVLVATDEQTQENVIPNGPEEVPSAGGTSTGPSGAASVAGASWLLSVVLLVVTVTVTVRTL